MLLLPSLCFSILTYNLLPVDVLRLISMLFPSLSFNAPCNLRPKPKVKLIAKGYIFPILRMWTLLKLLRTPVPP